MTGSRTEDMELTAIYFSGTGNTKYCVERFLQELNQSGKMYSIEEKEAIRAIKEHQNLLLAYPIQYSNLPEIMREFIKKNADLWERKNIFILTTMGLFSGDGSGLAARLLKKNGATIMGGLHIRMPDSIGDVRALKKPLEQNKEIVRRAESKIKDAAEKMKRGKITKEGLGFWYHLAGLFGQRLYFYNKTKKSKDRLKVAKDRCSGCGICISLCPMENLAFIDGKAAGKGNCTMCYRCISHCPKGAITLLGKEVIEQSRMEKYL